MGYVQYLELLASAPWLYVAALAIAFSAYIFILRKQIDSVFDPLFLNMVFAAIGASTVIFLLFTDNIETRNFVQYSLSELCYLLCLTIIPLRLGKIACHDKLLNTASSRRLLQCTYLTSSITFIAAQVIVYIQNGIPLLYESRLDYYSGGSGIGVFSRIISVSSYFCWYLLLHKYTYKWKIQFLPGMFDAFLVTCLVASSILSGSKGGLLVVIFLIFYFRNLHQKSKLYPESMDQRLRRVQKGTVGVAFCAALFVLLMTGFSSSLMGSLAPLLTRIASAGDTYFMAYPGNNLHDLDASHPLLAVFGSTLWMFRLIDKSSLVDPLGFQLFHNVVKLPLDVGPNPRHNVFGLVYFGYAGSLIYSSMLGFLVGFVRNVLLKYIRLGGISELVYVYVALGVIAVNTDLELFISSLDSFIITVPVILGSAYILDVGTRHVPLWVDHVYPNSL